MNTLGNICFFIFLFFISTFFKAQKAEKKSKYPISFSLNARVIMPSQFIGETAINLSDSPFESQCNHVIGYSFGGLVRTSFSKRFALETGLFFNQRHFNLSMSVLDSGITAQNDLTFISYEIPIQGRVFIKLGRKLFSSVAIGVSPNYRPSNVGVLNLPGGAHSFTHTGFLVNRMGIDFNSEFGFEWKDSKLGVFYFGSGFKIPLTSLFDLIGQYTYQGNKWGDYASVNAAFMFLDFRYFFPNIKNRGVQFKPGPIE